MRQRMNPLLHGTREGNPTRPRRRGSHPRKTVGLGTPTHAGELFHTPRR